MNHLKSSTLLVDKGYTYDVYNYFENKSTGCFYLSGYPKGCDIKYALSLVSLHVSELNKRSIKAIKLNEWSKLRC